MKWSFWPLVLPFLQGLVLLPLLLLRPNRRAGAWAVLIPWLLVWGVLWLVAFIMWRMDDVWEFTGRVPGALANSLAFAWLLLAWLQNWRHRWAAWLALALSMLAIGGVSYLCDFGFSRQVWKSLAVHAALGLALLLPLAAAAWVCRRRYSRLKFLPVWGLGAVVCGGLLVIPFASQARMLTEYLVTQNQAWLATVGLAAAGVAMVLGLCLLSLPFVLLLAFNRTYRERWERLVAVANTRTTAAPQAGYWK